MYVEPSSLALSPILSSLVVRRCMVCDWSVVDSLLFTFNANSRLHDVEPLYLTHTYCFLSVSWKLVFFCFYPFFQFVQTSLNLVWSQKLRAPAPQEHIPKAHRYAMQNETRHI